MHGIRCIHYRFNFANNFTQSFLTNAQHNYKSGNNKLIQTVCISIFTVCS